MKIKLLDDLKSLLNAPAETAAARLALSQALTGRVKQTCFVWCPVCRNELTAGGSEYRHTLDDAVVYTCSKCGTWSTWDFNPPVPLLIRHTTGRVLPDPKPDKDKEKGK